MELSKEDFTTLLNKYDAAYFHEKKPLISDSEYDSLVTQYENLYGKYVPNSMAGLKINVTPLPSYAPSLDKIKKRKDFYNYITKFHGPYVVMDKVDGMSIIVHYTKEGIKLFTHSTGGKTGSDVSHLINHINIPKDVTFILQEANSDSLEVRGELAILWDKVENEEYSPRNVISGAVLATKNIKYELIKKFTYFAFEVKKDMGMHDQLLFLQKLGFNVPKYEMVDELDYDELTKELKQRSNVPRDGKVLCTNDYVVPVKTGLPKHKIAFKILSETRKVKVTGVSWNESKYGKLKPRVHYETTNLEKGNCTNVTGYHAKFIKHHRVGPGAIILISRDIVPDIVEVIEEAEYGSMPVCEYTWDKTNTNIFVDMNDKVFVKRIYVFFKVLDAKFLGQKTIKKLYDGGLTSVNDVLNATTEQLCKMDGFQRTGASRIVASVKGVYSKVTLAKIMFGSCLFPNFDSKLQDVLDHIPDMFDILVYGKKNTMTEQDLQLVPGIKTLAIDFLNGIEPFQQFLATIPSIKEAIIKNYKSNFIEVDVVENIMNYGDIFTPPLPEPDDNTNVLAGMVIVFSGDKKLTEKAKTMGAVVDKGVTKRTSLLVIDDLSKMTTKQVKCINNGIQVMDLQTFKQTYNI